MFWLSLLSVQKSSNNPKEEEKTDGHLTHNSLPTIRCKDLWDRPFFPPPPPYSMLRIALDLVMRPHMPINIEVGGRGPKLLIFGRVSHYFCTWLSEFLKKNWKELPLIFCIECSKNTVYGAYKTCLSCTCPLSSKFPPLLAERPGSSVLRPYEFRDFYMTPKQTFWRQNSRKIQDIV